MQRWHHTALRAILFILRQRNQSQTHRRPARLVQGKVLKGVLGSGGKRSFVKGQSSAAVPLFPGLLRGVSGVQVLGWKLRRSTLAFVAAMPRGSAVNSPTSIICCGSGRMLEEKCPSRGNKSGLSKRATSVSCVCVLWRRDGEGSERTTTIRRYRSATQQPTSTGATETHHLEVR